MEKLIRFILLGLLYILLVCISLPVIPAIVWIFGGEYLTVLQNPFYLTWMIIIYAIVYGYLFDSCFDTEGYTKD